MARNKRNHPPHIDESAAKTCEAESCVASGLYKAPKSPYNLHDYHWFCLEHAEEYNRKWNYFADKDEDDIEAFIREAVTGHRPTWRRDGGRDGSANAARYAHYGQMLEDELARFLGENFAPKSHMPYMNSKEREALALLAIEQPCDAQTLKQAYRTQVKQYHPDLHQGDKAYEEKFKRITAAYMYLKEIYYQDQAAQ